MRKNGEWVLCPPLRNGQPGYVTLHVKPCRIWSLENVGADFSDTKVEYFSGQQPAPVPPQLPDDFVQDGNIVYHKDRTPTGNEPPLYFVDPGQYLEYTIEQRARGHYPLWAPVHLKYAFPWARCELIRDLRDSAKRAQAGSG